MLNFTVGPVQMNEDILRIGCEQIPYFRTSDFSALMLENEKIMLRLFDAPDDSRCVFLTGSGTAAMEAAVMNTLTEDDRAIIVNGGTFGERFAELCRLHRIPFEEIRLAPGEALTSEHLSPYAGRGFTAFLVNLHETSTGVLYDASLIGDFCRSEGLCLIVDAISAFIADPISMRDMSADVLLTGSQKALALPPGISIVALSPRAQARTEEYARGERRCLYLDFTEHLRNMERGQTPFTPAVDTLIRLNVRLRGIEERGLCSERAGIRALADDFRSKLKKFGFEILTDSPSNAVTAVRVREGVSAYRIFEILKDEYGIFVCPNGGELRERVFRVGHIGALTLGDNAKLLDALEDMKERGML